MPVELTPEQRNAIARAVSAGNKIHAIKLCREATGMGLAEAKDYVENLVIELQRQPSTQFTTQTECKGCFGVVVLAGLELIALVHSGTRVLAHTTTA
jgi:ribosomal L7/L12-like protein